MDRPSFKEIHKELNEMFESKPVNEGKLKPLDSYFYK